MKKTLCDHCSREFEPPKTGEYTFKVAGKNIWFSLSVITEFADGTTADICIDCVTYLCQRI